MDLLSHQSFANLIYPFALVIAIVFGSTETIICFPNCKHVSGNQEYEDEDGEDGLLEGFAFHRTIPGTQYFIFFVKKTIHHIITNVEVSKCKIQNAGCIYRFNLVCMSRLTFLIC